MSAMSSISITGPTTTEKAGAKLRLMDIASMITSHLAPKLILSKPTFKGANTKRSRNMERLIEENPR